MEGDFSLFDLFSDDVSGVDSGDVSDLGSGVGSGVGFSVGSGVDSCFVPEILLNRYHMNTYSFPKEFKNRVERCIRKVGSLNTNDKDDRKRTQILSSMSCLSKEMVERKIGSLSAQYDEKFQYHLYFTPA